MKNIFLSCFLLFVFTFSFAQTTWVQKLNDFYTPDNIYQSTGDIVTGIKKIIVGADGNLLMLAKTSQDSQQKIYKVSPDSGKVVWEIGVGWKSSLGGSYCTNISPTRDSGFIVVHNYENHISCNELFGFMEKYYKDGSLQWTGNHTQYPCFIRRSYDAIERQNGGYWVLLEDIAYKLDANGIMIDSCFISGKKIFELPNNDLLVQSVNGTVYRADSVGNISWTLPGNNNSIITVDTNLSYFYLTMGQGVNKISIANGTIIWTKNYAPSDLTGIDFAFDGGFEAGIGKAPSDYYYSTGGYVPSYIVRADSSGDTLWTRTFDFPQYGVTALKCLSNGNTIIGSGFLIGVNDAQYYDIDYRVLCASLDSNGNGDILHTGYVWPGDANDNQLLSFVDDAPDIMLADGFSGSPRLLVNPIYCCENFGKTSDIRIDWSTSYVNGVNHKNADFDGNGVVDTNDVISFASLWTWFNGFPDSINIQAPFRYQKPSNEISSIYPEFKLVAEQDTVLPGSDVNFFIIAGSQNNPIDSIYGLAFSCNPFLSIANVNSIQIYNSDFGTTGINLFNYSFQNQFQFSQRSSAIICRYDHQNTTNLFDTLGVISVSISPSVSTLTICELLVNEFKAILSDESIIPFNVMNGSVVIDGPVNVNENLENDFIAFPNPANGNLTIKSRLKTNKNIALLNISGQKIFETNSSEGNIIFETKDLPEGYYILNVNTDRSIIHIPISILH